MADLDSLSNALQEAPELRRVLRSPIVSREEHERVLEQLAGRLDVGDVVRNILGLLAQKRRLLVRPLVRHRFAESSELFRLMPHSTLPVPAHRPARGSSPSPTARVQLSGLQPMER